MNTALRVLVLAALAGGLWAGPAALAQSDKANVGQIGTIDGREAEEVQQVGATDRRDAEEVQQITPSTGGKVLIDPAAGQASRSAAVQQSGGRDLCDPSVPDSVRKAAGVDCSRQISIERLAGRKHDVLQVELVERCHHRRARRALPQQYFRVVLLDRRP